MRRSQRRGCPEGLVRLLVLAATFSTPTWGFNHPTVQCRRHITWPGREPSYVSGPNSIQVSYGDVMLRRKLLGSGKILDAILTVCMGF